MTLLYFIIILGVIIFIHELGHFIFAKKSGIYVYEFSLGMGPVIFKHNRKNDETDYCLRLFPIGGFVQMAGEEVEDDKSIPKDKKFGSKTFFQRFMTVIAGIMMNFILAIVLLFIVGLFGGSPQNKALVGEVDPTYPAYTAGIKEGDQILKVNGKNANTSDKLVLQLQVLKGQTINFEINRNGQIINIPVSPKEETIDGQVTYKYGFQINDEVEKGVFAAAKYAVTKTLSLVHQMIFIVFYLITGKLALGSLSGPVGIYTIVGSA
ncbi:MAG: site-2 protease family protein, partial [Bacilli bacterium]|nr:site-2 protease family protein [Bacilli bacterium]